MTEYWKGWPEVGKLKWWHRLLGFRDIRCDNCGTIGGVTHGRGGGRIVSCSHCPEVRVP